MKKRRRYLRAWTESNGELPSWKDKLNEMKNYATHVNGFCPMVALSRCTNFRTKQGFGFPVSRSRPHSSRHSNCRQEFFTGRQ